MDGECRGLESRDQRVELFIEGEERSCGNLYPSCRRTCGHARRKGAEDRHAGVLDVFGSRIKTYVSLLPYFQFSKSSMPTPSGEFPRRRQQALILFFQACLRGLTHLGPISRAWTVAKQRHDFF